MVARIINQIEGMSCPRTFDSCEEALAVLQAESLPQIILMDVGLPGMSGIAGIREIKARWPDVRVIVLTAYDDYQKVFDAICAGAAGYLLKSSSEEAIAAAIREVLGGGQPMSPRIARLVLDMFARMARPAKDDYGFSGREKQILELIVEGLITKEIADRLGLSYHTVDNHLRSIYGKLQVNTRGGAIAKALKERLL